MAIELNGNEVTISFRAGTTQALTMPITYYPDSTLTNGRDMDLTGATFEFIAYDRSTGRTKFSVDMEVSGNEVTCLLDYKRRVNASFAIVMTSGRNVTDMVTGTLVIY
jgi:hypothetical protein